jgi:hypothetical protein
MARTFFLTKEEGTESTAPSFAHPANNGPSASRSTRCSAPSVAWAYISSNAEWHGGPGSHWHYAILPTGSISGTSVEVSSWSGNSTDVLSCAARLSESIGPVQRPSADSFSIGISPQDGLRSPSHFGTLTTNTHHPRSRRLFLGGCLRLSLVVAPSHFSLETVTSEQRA